MRAARLWHSIAAGTTRARLRWLLAVRAGVPRVADVPGEAWTFELEWICVCR